MPVSMSISSGPAILLAFDDNGATVWTEAAAYMRAHNMKGTFYVIGSSVAGLAGQLGDMYGYGWDVANHSWDGSDMSGLTQGQVETQLTDCKTAIDALGHTRASSHVAYPGGVGETDAEVLAAMAATGMLTGRTTLRGVDESIPLADLYNINCDINLGVSTSLATAQAWVDDVISKGKIGISLGHHLVAVPSLETQWAIADFCALVDYIVAAGVPVITISQLYSLHSGQITVSMPY